LGTPWPHNSHEKLKAAGYVFLESKICKGKNCGATIHWYRTPKGKLMPFNTQFQPHFADCPDAKNIHERSKVKLPGEKDDDGETSTIARS
jgi:hypothetical protein